MLVILQADKERNLLRDKSANAENTQSGLRIVISIPLLNLAKS